MNLSLSFSSSWYLSLSFSFFGQVMSPRHCFFSFFFSPLTSLSSLSILSSLCSFTHFLLFLLSPAATFGVSPLIFSFIELRDKDTNDYCFEFKSAGKSMLAIIG